MNIAGKEIVLNPYTRAIAKAVNEKLLDGVIVWTVNGEQTMNVPAVNADRSEQLLIRLMTWLTDNDIDALLQEEYIELKKVILEKISGEKK